MLAGLFNTCVAVNADAALTLEHTDNAGITSPATSNTFSAINLGAPAADRLVIVGSGLRRASSGSPITTSVTVGGVSATEIDSSPGTARQYSLWSAIVPAGTAADITVSLNISSDQLGIVVWTLKNHSSAAHIDSGNSDSGGTFSTVEGGVAVTFMGVNRTTSISFTNMDEDADFTIGSGCTIGGASNHNTPASSLTFSASSGDSFPKGVYASWS